MNPGSEIRGPCHRQHTGLYAPYANLSVGNVNPATPKPQHAITYQTFSKTGKRLDSIEIQPRRTLFIKDRFIRSLQARQRLYRHLIWEFPKIGDPNIVP